jgi:putative addiction module component (TIGR02574 family)
MKTSDLIKEIDNLELAEKILLVEDIWDSIARNNEKLPLPHWQRVEIEKRYADFKNGDLKLHDWQNVHEDLRKKYR